VYSNFSDDTYDKVSKKIKCEPGGFRKKLSPGKEFDDSDIEL